MFCGALSLMAADGDSAPGNGKGEGGGRGKRWGHGGKGNVTFLICPNCHHRLVVRAVPDRGKGEGGKEGRDGKEWRGPRRGGKDRRPENRPQPPPDDPTPTEEKKAD